MNLSRQCEFSFELAPYILGELGEADQRSVREHVVGCSACSRDLEEFCGTISLLECSPTRLGQEAAPQVIESTKRRDRSESLLDRQKSKRWLAVSLVAAVAVALGFVGGSAYSNVGARTVDLLRGSQNVGYSTVMFQSMSWGTEMRFKLSEIPKVPEIGAWIKAENGTRSTICWWPLTPSETSGIFVASTPLSYAQIKSIGITTKSNRSLWWSPVRSTSR